MSESALFTEIFSNNPPQPGKPRLRIVSNDGSKTFENVHRGARALADGLYTAIRNPISHTPGELPEHEALERLAAFSVLARWLDESTIEAAL
ncbi:MAG: TIGR02391 family protein [Pseudonocardiaceae bacterium]